MVCYIIAAGVILGLILVSAIAYAAGGAAVLDDLRNAAYRMGEDDVLDRIEREANRDDA